jgi:hypothetical protein
METTMNLTTMTAQELFDVAVAGVIRQGRQSEVGCSCRYRIFKPDGTTLKCAVGMILPDDRYNPRYDHLAVSPADVLKKETWAVNKVLRMPYGAFSPAGVRQLGELKFMNSHSKMNTARPPSNDTSQALEAMYLIQMKQIESGIKEEKVNECLKKEMKSEQGSMDDGQERDLNAGSGILHDRKVLHQDGVDDKVAIKDTSLNANASVFAKIEPDCGSKSEPN